MSAQRYLIVGNSAAALTALESIRRRDSEGPVTLIAEEEGPPYSRVLLPYLISGERTDISIRDPAYYERMNARAILGTRAAEVRDGSVFLEDGREIPFDKLLLATGSRAAIPSIEGVDGPGVFTVKNLEDAQAMRRDLAHARRALIVGGGLVCLLVVRALLERGLRLTIAVSSDRVLSRMLDREGSARVQRRLRDAGVEVLTHTDVEALVREGGKLRAAVTSEGRELPADVVILAKGIRSRIDLAESAGLETSRGILVDQYMRTSRPDIYAAGDCAEAPDMLLRGKKTICATWFEAVSQGETAGSNMAGVSRPTFGALKMNVMETMGLPVASIGLTEAPAPEAEVMLRMGPGSYRKLIVWGDRLVGAVLVGDVSEAGLITMLIKRRRKLSELRRLDLRGPLSYARLAAVGGA